MCQIQFVKRLGKQLTRKDIQDFSNLVNLGSYYNKDSYGFSNQNGLIYKDNTKHSFSETYKRLIKGKHDFLIGHNRLQTQGSAEKEYNNHPFETTNFVVVHNGMISNDDKLKEHFDLDYEVETDSYIIPALLEMELSKGVDKDIPEIISQVASYLSGTFSVIIHHKPSNRLFYFKNYSTKFTFALVTRGKDKIIMGSTDDTNFEDILTEKVYGIFDKITDDYLTISPDDSIVYEITDEGIYTKEVFEFKNVIPVKVKQCQSRLTFQDRHGHTETFFQNSPISKKKILKTIAKNIDSVLNENNCRPINRAYSEKEDKIFFYFNKESGMSTNTLQMLQDMVVEYAYCDYLSQDEKNPSQSKLILNVDMKDVKEWFEGKSYDTNPHYTDAELSEEIDKQIRREINDEIKEESLTW